MKALSFLLLVTIGTSANATETNFNTPKKQAEVCNVTDQDSITHSSDNAFGRTRFAVVFQAWGCFESHLQQARVCNVQYLEPTQCAHYHYRQGTSGKKAFICLPHGHGNPYSWSCGSPGSGHLGIDMNNDTKAMVKGLRFTHSTDMNQGYDEITGKIATSKLPDK